VDRLLNPEPPTTAAQETLAGLREAVGGHADPSRLKAWWLYRMLYGKDPLGEKMTLFWHGHFATSNRKVRSVALMLRQNETFRRHALGDFRKLLAEMVSDPAMLIWLDGRHNRRRTWNENFGREFLELFSLGVGNYSEADVRAASRAFTGFTGCVGGDFEADLAASGIAFNPEEFDPGEKTFLGQKGRWGWKDIVRITLEQPAAAEFLCRKLYRFLVAEEPAPTRDLIRPLADQFRAGAYSVRQLVSTMLRSRHFFGHAAYRARVKGPIEYSVGLVRCLELPAEDVRLLAVAAACDRQGQELFYPPNVKGWDGGRAWLNTSATLERTNWVADVIWGNPEIGWKPFDPLRWAERNAINAGQVTRTLANLAVQGDLSKQALKLVLETGTGATADRLRKALQVALHCPIYQLA
jgi:uncharacterized protein (DUF1800 family)